MDCCHNHANIIFVEKFQSILEGFFLLAKTYLKHSTGSISYDEVNQIR